MLEPRQGWRYFRCDNCENSWKQTSRDTYSLSGESCDKCQEWVRPHDGLIDESIKVDNFGNLTEGTKYCEL